MCICMCMYVGTWKKFSTNKKRDTQFVLFWGQASYNNQIV